jgi:glycopeptide antibiotics resistance protein
MGNTTGARLAAALLGYITLVIVLVTLNPFYFALPERPRISAYVKPDDVVANVLLFLPVGFLYRLTGGRRRGALLLGAAISAAVEAAQLFVPVRVTSAVDIVMNTLGAGVGAVLYDLLAARVALTPRVVGRLALEIPLMSLIYLLVPLLWANALTLDDAPGRWALAALVGASGAMVIGDIYRQWRGPAGLRAAARVGLAAGGWFLVGAGPILLARALPAFAMAAGVAVLAAALAALPWRSPDRRFERTTLSRFLPIFALYLALSALWPPLRPLVPWHGTIGLADRLQSKSVTAILPLIEYLAAFTVLGYLAAEWRSRSEITLARDLPRLLLVAAASALALEFFAGFQAGLGASLARALLVIGGALLGGTIYHLQRDHVRSLLGRSPAR